MGVPLIHVPPKEMPIGSEPEVTLMDVDPEAVQTPTTADLTNPTSTNGRDVGLPQSLRSAVMSMPPPDGPSELPGKKKRRVMFADE